MARDCRTAPPQRVQTQVTPRHVPTQAPQRCSKAQAPQRSGARQSEPGVVVGASVMLRIGLVASVFSVATEADAAPQTYRLQARKSSLVAHLLKGGVAAGLAHDHVVAARRVSGTIVFDPEQPQRSAIRIRVDARSLDPDPPALRRKYGMQSILDRDDRREVARNLHGRDQLHTSKYPRLTFVSTAVSRMKRDAYRVSGKLTLRGVTRKTAFRARVVRKQGILRATAHVRLRQSDFGYQPYSAALGTVKVKDEVTLNIYLEGRRD
jgi:polyisoprenoid-binding protein YceI